MIGVTKAYRRPEGGNQAQTQEARLVPVWRISDANGKKVMRRNPEGKPWYFVEPYREKNPRARR